MVPTVCFTKMVVEDNLDCLVYYSHPENSKNSPLDFYNFMLALFPELCGKVTEGMSDEEIYMVLDKEIRPILDNLYKNSNDVEKYQAIWDKIGYQIMKDLEDRLQVKWSNEKNIFVRIGLFPVLSRDIVGRTFDINYGSSEDLVIATGIHELCHIIYFEKWKQLYPNYSEEEFDNPHIAWYLSEAMIDPLINNDVFKKYTNEDLSSYSVFYETYIDDKSIIDILRDYVKSYPIDVAIKRGYKLFLENEDIIKR